MWVPILVKSLLGPLLWGAHDYHVNPTKMGAVCWWGNLSIVNLGKFKSKLPFSKISLADLYLGVLVFSLDSSTELIY